MRLVFFLLWTIWGHLAKPNLGIRTGICITVDVVDKIKCIPSDESLLVLISNLPDPNAKLPIQSLKEILVTKIIILRPPQTAFLELVQAFCNRKQIVLVVIRAPLVVQPSPFLKVHRGANGENHIHRRIHHLRGNICMPCPSI